LLATDYGGPKISHKLANVMAEGYGQHARQQKVIAFGLFLGLSLPLSSFFFCCAFHLFPLTFRLSFFFLTLTFPLLFCFLFSFYFCFSLSGLSPLSATNNVCNAMVTT
jgi:cellulose synthase/poly-beta-1,6-N-acetylglucosamine synthase-like glycosyltransferase